MISRRRRRQKPRRRQQQQQQQQQKRYGYTFDPAETKEHTIFISIPSYRDPEVVQTISDAYAKAAYPERVFIGVCEQNYENDEDCLASTLAQRYKQNIRVQRMEAVDAKGPTFARAVIDQLLYDGEDFFMGIDSHTIFRPGWDAECIAELVQCESEKPILTCYPHEYERRNHNLGDPNMNPSFLRFRDFHHRLKFPQQERATCYQKPVKPLPSLFWSAGFSFTRGEAVKEVPYDSNLDFLFLGEEITMNARYFTHGWDLFTPTQNLVFHLSDRSYRPLFWEQIYNKQNQPCLVDERERMQRKAKEEQSIERAHALLSGHLDDDTFGLGTARTLDEFYEYNGLDIQNQTAKRHTRFGLTRIPESYETYAKYGQHKMTRR